MSGQSSQQDLNLVICKLAVFALVVLIERGSRFFNCTEGPNLMNKSGV
jgi:hypothetical protein